jgi:hypothetical protein
MLEIERFGDTRLCRQELACAARRRGHEGHSAARRDGGDGADERQVPDDVADAALGLNDRGFSQWGCRAEIELRPV